MNEWSVNVECLVGSEITDEMIDDILERLQDRGVALSYSQDGRQMSVQLTVEAEDGVAAFQAAVAAVGHLPYPLASVGGRIWTVEALERELDQPPLPELVGVAEVAEELKVSKARVNELQDLPAFPQPIARLKSGPVWTRPSLTHFIDGWQRRPGRPRKSGRQPTTAAPT